MKHAGSIRPSQAILLACCLCAAALRDLEDHFGSFDRAEQSTSNDEGWICDPLEGMRSFVAPTSQLALGMRARPPRSIA
jgi:hypothetical protein